MITNLSGTSYKNKNTGEIVSLWSRCWSSKESTCTYYTKDGNPVTIKEETFDQNFERVLIDYQEYKDNIIEACYLNTDFQRLANVVLKRLDPDYLKVGDIVYFEHPECYFKKDTNYIDYGPEKPYEIVKIVPDKDGRKISWVIVTRKGRIHKNNNYYEDGDFRLPIYYDRLEPNDAHWYLKRYDKAY